MKPLVWLVVSFMLLGFPCYGESLAGYYLRFVQPEEMFSVLLSLVYVFCGLGSFFSLASIFQKWQTGDHEAEKSARQWCMSLGLVGIGTFIISSLVEDYRATNALNLAATVGTTTTEVKGSFAVFSKLVYVACGLVALLVLPRKFYAMQAGDRRAGRSLTSWGLGLIGMVAMVYIIHQIFFT